MTLPSMLSVPGGAQLTEPNKINAANLWAWYRGDGVTGNITSIDDKSGGGLHLDTKTGTPIILSAGGPNGRDAFEFDGTEEMWDATFPLTAGFDLHTYTVLRIGTFAAADVLLQFMSNVGSTTNPHVEMTAAQVETSGYDGALKVATATEAPAADNWFLMECQWEDGVAVRIRINNGTLVSTAIGAMTVTAGIGFGGNNNAANLSDADVAEIIIYETGILSAADHASIIAYINSRYSLF